MIADQAARLIARRSNFKVEMAMLAAAWVERGLTVRAAIGCVNIGLDRQFKPTGAAEHGMPMAFVARPDHGLMVDGLVMAATTGEVTPAALELDGDDVEIAVVVDAACLFINGLSKNGHLHLRITFPHRSTVAFQFGGTTIVDSAPSINVGPVVC